MKRIDIEKIRALASENSITESIDLLLKSLNYNKTEHINMALVIKSRFNELRKKEILGTIRYDDYAIENSRIVYAILNLVDIISKRRTKSSTSPEAINQLTTIPYISNKNFLGRETELKSIQNKLNSSDEIIVLTGIGGIGKTTIAKRFVSINKNNYEHIIWINLNRDESILEKIVNHKVLISNLNLIFPEKINNQEKFELIINKMQNLHGKNLMIIDNANLTLESIKDKLPHPPNWHLLATSRIKMEAVESMNINSFSIDSSIRLFNHYCKKKISTRKLVDLFELTGYHTLLIEIISKILRDSETISIETIIKRLNSNRFIDNQLKLNSIVDFSEKEKDAYTSLISSFELIDISPIGIEILRLFGILPSVDLTFNRIKNILRLDESDTYNYDKAISKLAKTGLLNKSSNGYKCHQLIQEVIKHKLDPNYANCYKIVSHFTEIFKIDDNYNPHVQIPDIPFIESILGNIIERNSEIGNLHTRLGIIYTWLSEYNKSLTCHKIALEIANEVSDEDLRGSVLSNLGLVYIELGKYKIAETYCKDALALDIKVNGPNHDSIDAKINNLADVYFYLGEYEKAKPLIEKTIKNGIRRFGENNIRVSQRMNGLALIYHWQENFEKAEELYQTSIKIAVKYYKTEYHPEVAIRMANLADMLVTKNEFNRAKDILDKVLNIQTTKYTDKQHIEIGKTHYKIARYYRFNHMHKEAYYHIKEALSICKEKYPDESHTYIIRISKHMEEIKSEMEKEIKKKNIDS